jgi:beta-lactamase superfamily II metal-dependent hydrolase
MTASASGTLRVRVLDVGQGDAILVFLPGARRALVVDAFDGERVIRALEENAIDEIILFLSHSDKDHVDGVHYLLDNFRGHFLAFFYNKDRLNARLESPYAARLRILAQATREQAMKVKDVWSGDFNTNLNSDGRFPQLVPVPISLEVLHPTHDEQSSLLGTSTNETAGILRIVYTFSDGVTRTVLLTGDLQLTRSSRAEIGESP